MICAISCVLHNISIIIGRLMFLPLLRSRCSAVWLYVSKSKAVPISMTRLSPHIFSTSCILYLISSLLGPVRPILTIYVRTPHTYQILSSSTSMLRTYQTRICLLSCMLFLPTYISYRICCIPNSGYTRTKCHRFCRHRCVMDVFIVVHHLCHHNREVAFRIPTSDLQGRTSQWTETF